MGLGSDCIGSCRWVSCNGAGAGTGAATGDEDSGGGGGRDGGEATSALLGGEAADMAIPSVLPSFSLPAVDGTDTAA